jgi:glycine reductase
MKLEMFTFPVSDVRFGQKTGYMNGVLEINKEKLLEPLLSDKNIESADLDIAFPGEKTRIVRVRDVVEPRVKVSGPGCVFPAIMGQVETGGEGRDHTLSNVVVTITSDWNYERNLGSGGQNSGIIDMWGPGAELAPYGSLINVVLMVKLVDPITEVDAGAAIQLAGYRLAKRLAETTKDLTSDDLEVFELSDVDPSLPRVLYDATLSTTWHEPQMQAIFNGLPLRESLATLIHPNEVLDGAITPDVRRGNGECPRSWEWMNNPVVLGLLRQHGKTVNFLGVIVQRTRFEAEWCKVVGAETAAQVGRLLHADGVILTKISPSGNNSMDLMFTVQAFEKRGIKAVFVTPEYGGAEGKEQAQWFYAPEAVAMVSTSSLDRGHQLEAPAKVIGCEKGEIVEPYPDEPIQPWDALFVERMTFMTGSIDYLGHMHHTCRMS